MDDLQETQWHCGKCNKTFSEQTGFQQHTCTNNEEISNTLDEWNRNVRESSRNVDNLPDSSECQNKPYECHVCNKRFGKARYVKRHMLIHTGGGRFACDVCGRGFGDKTGLRNHSYVHTGEKPYLCKVCNKGFRQPINLRRHMYQHTGGGPFQCVICNRGFTTVFTLTEHMNLHTGEKPFKCHVCNKAFAHSGNLKHHISIHPDVKVLETTSHVSDITDNITMKPPGCQLYNQDKDEYITKMPIPGNMDLSEYQTIKNINNSNEVTGHCVTINTKFSKNSENIKESTRFPESHSNSDCIESHHTDIAKVTPLELKNSDDPQFDTETAQSKTDVRIVYIGGKQFKCSICGKQCIQSSDLKKHMYTHTGEKPFKCNMCGRAFRQSSNLRRHEGTHNKGKLLQINKELKEFPLRKVVNRETKIHDTVQVEMNSNIPTEVKACEEKMLSNDLGPETKFETEIKPASELGCVTIKTEMVPFESSLGNVDTHNHRTKTVVYTTEKPFKCHYCDRSFLHASTLKTHIRVHSGAKPYQCHVCSKAFNQRSNLNRHLTIHSRTKIKSPNKWQENLYINNATEKSSNHIIKDISKFSDLSTKEDSLTIADSVIIKTEVVSDDDEADSMTGESLGDTMSIYNDVDESDRESNYIFNSAPQDKSEESTSTIGTSPLYKCNKCNIEFKTPKEEMENKCPVCYYVNPIDKEKESASTAYLKNNLELVESQMITMDTFHMEDIVMEDIRETIKTETNLDSVTNVSYSTDQSLNREIIKLANPFKSHSTLTSDNDSRFVNMNIVEERVPVKTELDIDEVVNIHIDKISNLFDKANLKIKREIHSSCGKDYSETVKEQLEQMSLEKNKSERKSTKQKMHDDNITIDRICADYRINKCHFCDVEFLRPSALKTHLCKHTGERPYKCKICSKGFTKTSNLKRHMTTHINTIYKDFNGQCEQLNLEEIKKIKSDDTATLGQLQAIDTAITISKKEVHIESIKSEDFGYSEVITKSTLSKNNSVTDDEAMTNDIKPLNMLLEPSESAKSVFADNSKRNQANFQTGMKRGPYRKRKSRLENGIPDWLNDKLHSCLYCDMVFVHSSGLKTHMYKHSGERPFQCYICKKGFTQSSNLKRHMNTHSNIKYLTFNKCNKTGSHMAPAENNVVHTIFSNLSPSNYSNTCHQEISLNNEKIEAIDCVGVTSDEKKDFTSQKRFTCQECGIGFDHYTHLKIHKYKHTGEKPFTCHYCNKGFTQSGNLHIHLRVHTGEKPFHCNVCNKRFRVSDHLKLHMNLHTGERPYSCKICNQKFAHPTGLKNHMFDHTGEMPFKCKECNKGFKRSEKLSTHMKIHTGEKPFVCHLCFKGFTTAVKLKSHVQSHT